jgi:tyrosyl-tRNA synthetase
MKLSEELKARGFIHQFSGESLEKILDEEKRTFYLGTDPSATSLTVGNLAVYMLVRHLADAGHTPILLVGGATGMIGDPGGKESERTLLDEETLQKNIAGIRGQVEKILKIENVTVVNNADWLSKLSLIDFLREVGKHFTVNSMIKKDIVKNRLDAESPISYTEFSYSLLQGYDFRHLFDTHTCTLQVSGSDQWTNALAGTDFIRKTRQAESYALTIPIIVNPATGKKFGKSEEGALWLDPEQTSPYKLYQYFLNVDDLAADTLLKIYTLLSLDEIDALNKDTQENPQERKAQKALAYEVTKFVHTEAAAQAAQSVSTVLFGGTDIDQLTQDELTILKQEAPSIVVEQDTPLLEVLIAAEFAKSKTDARTLIEAGSVSISGVKILDTNFTLDEGDFSQGLGLLRKGKKNLMVLVLA